MLVLEKTIIIFLGLGFKIFLLAVLVFHWTFIVRFRINFFILLMNFNNIEVSMSFALDYIYMCTFNWKIWKHILVYFSFQLKIILSAHRIKN